MHAERHLRFLAKACQRSERQRELVVEQAARRTCGRADAERLRERGPDVRSAAAPGCKSRKKPPRSRATAAGPGTSGSPCRAPRGPPRSCPAGRDRDRGEGVEGDREVAEQLALALGDRRDGGRRLLERAEEIAEARVGSARFFSTGIACFVSGSSATIAALMLVPAAGERVAELAQV